MSSVVTRNLSIDLGGKKILQNIDFEAKAGQVVGLIGPNGAGKSTFLKLIVGLLPIGSGVIEIAGVQAGSLSRQDRAREVSYLPQRAEVHWPLSAESLVALGRYPHGRLVGKEGRQDGIIKKALKDVDGWHLRQRNVLSLSVGERARILLARALAVQAPVLLVDEPVASLDPEHQLKVMQALQNLAREGRTVVIVLHDLTLASRFCDVLYLLNNGRLSTSGMPDKVLTAHWLKTVYKITAKNNQGMIVPWEVL